MTKDNYYVCFWQYGDIVCSPLINCKSNHLDKLQCIFDIKQFLSVVEQELINHFSDNEEAVRHFEAFKIYLVSEICASHERAKLINFVMHFMEKKINQFHPILNERMKYEISNSTKNVHLLLKSLEGIFNAFHNTSLANNIGRINASIKPLINNSEYYVAYISTYRCRTLFQKIFNSEPDFLDSRCCGVNDIIKITGNSKRLKISFKNTPYTLVVDINGFMSSLFVED